MRLAWILPTLLFGQVISAQAQEVDWAGFYAGMGVGAGVMSTSFSGINTLDTGAPTLGDVEGQDPLNIDWDTIPDVLTHHWVPGDLTVFSEHILAGVAMRHGALVFGLEADAEFGWQLDTRTRCSGEVECIDGGVLTTVSPLGHVRGIVGAVISDNMMGFVSGGLAAAVGGVDVGHELHFPPQDGIQCIVRGEPQRTLMFAPSVGAGIDVRATDALRIRAEGIVDLYSASLDVGPFRAFSFCGIGENDPGLAAEANVDGTAQFGLAATARVSFIWEM
jgi:opacity protein-like surface antigen